MRFARSTSRCKLEQLSPMPDVERIRASFALERVRYGTALALGFV